MEHYHRKNNFVIKLLKFLAKLLLNILTFIGCFISLLVILLIIYVSLPDKGEKWILKVTNQSNFPITNFSILWYDKRIKTISPIRINETKYVEFYLKGSSCLGIEMRKKNGKYISTFYDFWDILSFPFFNEGDKPKENEIIIYDDNIKIRYHHTEKFYGREIFLAKWEESKKCD